MTEQTSWITEEQVSGQLDLVLDAPDVTKSHEPAADVVLVEVSPPRMPKQTTTGAGNPALAARFVVMADKLAPEIEAKLSHDRLTNTPKRMAQAMSARVDGERLRRTEQALRALARLHEAGKVPALLADLKSKKSVWELLGAELAHVSNGYHGYHTDTGKPRDNASPQALEVWALTRQKDPREVQADKIAQMERDLQFTKIPGFFATPPELVSYMLDQASICNGMTVLEPSAGSGAILDAICNLDDVIPGAYEVNGSLREILTAKGHALLGSDFLEHKPAVGFDRIVMNPPFEKSQDIDHVCHAYASLNVGGRLVSVMSPGPFFRNDNKAKKFRQFFEAVGGTVEDLDDGTFNGSGTGVATKLIIIDKE